MEQRNDAPAVNASLVRRLLANQFPQWANLKVRPVEEGGHDSSTFNMGNKLSVRMLDRNLEAGLPCYRA